MKIHNPSSPALQVKPQSTYPTPNAVPPPSLSPHLKAQSHLLSSGLPSVPTAIVPFSDRAAQPLRPRLHQPTEY
ncbi:superantigen-like protein SSL4 [Prochlorothrix hollandica]|uniref:hypothetical protein n=1 Tax=Prochlorothrix hollandica TaxID=1223 RepID=UPI0003468C87|nr:hypothetical protein [Prochlorothrix hollandica]